MARKKTALLMTVGTGVGDDIEKAREDLAHGMLFSIDERNPDIVILFGSEKSKLTVNSLKNQYLEENGEEFDFYEYVQIDNIDTYEDYFNAFKSKIQELQDEYRIVIDYTSGTKTMTMSAALASMIFRKKLIVVAGERKNGTVIRGTEKIVYQNLFPIYDGITIDQIKELFNSNRFETAKSLLDDIVDTRINKEIYNKLITSYSHFDNVNYKCALESFKLKEFQDEWPDLSSHFLKNIQALNRLNNSNDGHRMYYNLASLLNNARRRFEEHRYDDAIARLYRSLELIGQIKLEQYGLDSSNVDIEIVKGLIDDEDYIAHLESTRNNKGLIKIGLIEDYELLSRIKKEDLGKFYKENKGKFLDCVNFRNESILAHGEESKSVEEYCKFRDLVVETAAKLTNKLDKFIDETMFPEFEL